MLTNRSEAGKKLAQKLANLRGKDAVIVALPRGGVVVGYEIARRLSLPLDILAVRKIGHPANPEYAIGAIDEQGTRILSEAEATAVDQAWLERESERQMREAKRRSSLYRGSNRRRSLKGKTVVLVDDGIATGFTLRLALRSVKNDHPRKVIVAVPVAPSEILPNLHQDGVVTAVVLENPDEFMGAIGAHYHDFTQVEDEEVIRLLADAHNAHNSQLSE